MARQITVDEEQLEELVERKIAERGGAVEAPASAAKVAAEAIKEVFGISQDGNTIEQRVHAQLGTPVPPRECLRTMHQQCLNPRNGARFTAVIVPSREWKD